MRSINKYLNAISTNTVFFVVNSVFFLTITPIAVKVMGDELYGSWAILSAIVAFSQIGSFGIGSVVTKFSAPSTNEKTLLDVNAIITSAFLIILPLTILTVAILISLRDIIVNSINVNSVFHKQFYDAFLVMVLSIFPTGLLVLSISEPISPNPRFSLKYSRLDRFYCYFPIYKKSLLDVIMVFLHPSCNVYYLCFVFSEEASFCY